MKIKLEESDLKTLIEKIITEDFELRTPEMKLEFIENVLGTVVRDMNSEPEGDLEYYKNRMTYYLERIIRVLKMIK